MIPFEEFEQAVMKKIMEADTQINKILKQQYEYAVIEKRIFSGAGFFTDFKISENVPKLSADVPYAYGDIIAIINEIEGFGFILFIENGGIKCLEGYTWTDSWPEKIYSYTLSYSNQNK